MSKIHTSVAKRFKLTKRGKILHLSCGQDHFRARKSGKIIKNKHRSKPITSIFRKIIKKSI